MVRDIKQEGDMIKAIQFIESGHDRSDVETMLDGLKCQAGYIGGRVLPPKDAIDNTWRVQAFFDANGEQANWLPDGCRYVVVPRHLLK